MILGKAHIHFQHKISGKTDYKSMMEKDEWNYTHRHELSSLGFFACLSKRRMECNH